MKKLFIAFLITGMALGTVEGQVSISGQVRTGLGLVKNGDEDLMAGVRNTNNDAEAGENQRNDDFGANTGTGRKPTTPMASPGRIQLNFNMTNGILQFRSRLEMRGATSTSTDSFSESDIDQLIPFAYVMTNVWDNQFRISAGKIGNDTAVWNTLGPRIKAVQEDKNGIRLEYRPSFLKGLDVGFTAPARFLKFEDYLLEMFWGVRYNQANFIDVRAGILLDGKGDDAENAQAGGIGMYRFNPMFIGSYLPGFSVWINGRFRGIPTVGGTPNRNFRTDHWLYLEYTRGPIKTVGLHTGIEIWGNANYEESWNGPNGHYKIFALYLKPVFNYQINNYLDIYAYVQGDLTLGYDLTAAGVKPDFLPNNGKVDEPGFFERLETEIRCNINPGAGFLFTPAYRLTVYPGNTSRNWQADTVFRHEVELRVEYSF